MDGRHCDKAALRVLAFLRRGKTLAEGSARRDAKLLRRGDGGVLCVRCDLLAALAGRGLVSVAADAVAIAPAGSALLCAQPAAAESAREIELLPREDGLLAINLAESPLAVLVRLRDRRGKPFLEQAEFDAGERLRADYTRGRIMPRLGANWEASVAPGRRGAGGGLVELTDAALAARQRVRRALEAVGPELSGVLVDVCCFLKGLELVERERGWPVRSAKIVLKTALGALGRHYGHAPPASARPVLHWGTDDFRPRID